MWGRGTPQLPPPPPFLSFPFPFVSLPMCYCVLSVCTMYPLPQPERANPLGAQYRTCHDLTRRLHQRSSTLQP